MNFLFESSVLLVKEKRCLRTTRILENCLAEKNFQILRSTKFTKEKFPQLEPVFKSEKTFLVYPSEQSISLNELGDLIKKAEEKSPTDKATANEPTDSSNDFFHAIILDGTWHHAESIFHRNLELQKLKQVSKFFAIYEKKKILLKMIL